jgi:serine/threonine protein kinase
MGNLGCGSKPGQSIQRPVTVTLTK